MTLAEAYYANKQYDETLKCYSTVTHFITDPQTLTLLKVQIAKCLYNKGLVDQAIALYTVRIILIIVF